MSEMDLLKRIEALENKVAELENTLNTIGMMEKSERITEYLQNRRRNQSLVSLVNSMSDEEVVISHQEAENEKRMAKEQKQLELQIKNAIQAEKNSTYYAGENEHLFSYEFNPTGITITGYNGFDSDTLVIPAKIMDRVVNEIGESAFENLTCKNIIIPDSVTHIGSQAFQGCKSLKSINFPSGLCSLGNSCFSKSGIERIVIPPTVSTIPFLCFSICKSLREVVISEGVTQIESDAFFACDGLTRLIFPKSMELVSSELFGGSRLPKCDLVFLGMNTMWKVERSIFDKFPRYDKYIVFCAPGSKILHQSRQNNCEIHPLSEYFNK